MKDSRSIAKQAQQKHWETTGQLSGMVHLSNYILRYNKFLTPAVKRSLIVAEAHLREALRDELRNSEFINLNKRRV